jgi:hypothetical protein
MTALERRWVESEWEQETAHWSSRKVDACLCCGLDAVEYADTHGWVGFYNGGNGVSFDGPEVRTLAEAKSDAEAMYRQWVYDEYGVVLA